MNELVPVRRESVWIAFGLRRRWRVCSMLHTYAEFAELDDAREFLRLLVVGNPDLEPLTVAYTPAPWDAGRSFELTARVEVDDQERGERG